MFHLSAKKLILVGFVLVLLITIPVLIWFLQQQQQTESKAQKSTTLSFAPTSSAASPIQAQLNADVNLDIMVDPGVNLVGFARLVITYDQTKLATISGQAFENNPATFPVILEGPVYTPGKILVTVTTGADTTKVVQTLAKVGTVRFKAVGPTGNTPTQVLFSNLPNETQVMSITGPAVGGPNDQFAEDVLSTVQPAFIAIAGAETTETPTPTEALQASVTPSPTLSLTATPTTTPTASGTATPTPTGTATGNSNQSPACSSLVADRETSGTAPFSIAFTATGTDSDGTINKVTFNFGDGPVQDVTQSGGIGTGSVSVQTSHTYNNSGTYSVTAIFTDEDGAVSTTGSCSLTVTVSATAEETSGGTTDGTGSTSSTAEVTAAPTIASTGPGQVIFGIGAILALITIVGGLLFFVI